MRKQALLCGVLLTVLSVGAARAPATAQAVTAAPPSLQEITKQTAANALVVTLTGWIVKQTKFREPRAPRIAFLPREAMLRIYYGTEQASGYLRLLAFYNWLTATIHLPDTWDPADLLDRSILLHELVHHVQRANQVRVPCRARLEQQAYDFQAEWLSEQGVTEPFEFIGTDDFTIRILFACADDD